MYTKNIISAITILGLFLTSCIKDEDINPESTPLSNFELLWDLVDTRYCYFDLKKVDWDSVKTVYQEEIYSGMSDKELFEVCSQMLAELKDGHVNLSSPFNRSRYWDWFTDYPQNFDKNIVLRNYFNYEHDIVGPFNSMRLGDVGYIMYTAFIDDFTKDDVITAVEAMGEIDGLIIDIRDNGGGYLDLAHNFVSLFIEEKTHVAYTRYKTGPDRYDFSEFYPSEIDPSDELIDMPVVILTNRNVYSAANIFVASMNVLENVTLIGDKTGGGGGMPLSFDLYNGWSVRFSTNPMYDIHKNHIEFGIDPDIKVDMDPDEMAAGIDSILEEAIYYLSGQYFNR